MLLDCDNWMLIFLSVQGCGCKHLRPLGNFLVNSEHYRVGSQIHVGT
jgi:hypothetical protein